MVSSETNFEFVNNGIENPGANTHNADPGNVKNKKGNKFSSEKIKIETVNKNEDDESSSDSKPKSKRNRMPLSCTVCRKRKVKCDRGRPHCQVCEKYKVTHLCTYHEPTWANSDGENVNYVKLLSNKQPENTETKGFIKSNSKKTAKNLNDAVQEQDQYQDSSAKRQKFGLDQFISSASANSTAMPNLASIIQKQPNHYMPSPPLWGNQYSNQTPPVNYRPMNSDVRSEIRNNSFSSNSSPFTPAIPFSQNTSNGFNNNNNNNNNNNTRSPPKIGQQPISFIPAYNNISFDSSRSSTQSESNNQQTDSSTLSPPQPESLSSSVGQPVINEIQMLKDKIKQIEASIAVTDLSHPRTMHSLAQNEQLSPRRLAGSYTQTSLPPIISLNSNHNNVPENESPVNHFPPLNSRQGSTHHFCPLSNDSTAFNLSVDKSIVFEPNYSSSVPVSTTNAAQRNDRIADDKINITKTLEIDAEISTLLKYLKINPDDRIEFYEGFSPMMYRYSRINNYGPLAWIAIVLKDPFSKTIRDEIISHKKRVGNRPNTTIADKRFEKRVLDTTGLEDIKPLAYPSDKSSKRISSQENEHVNQSQDKPKFTVNEMENKSNMSRISFSGFTLSKRDSEKMALEHIINVLPNRKILWLLVKRFFKFIYPFVPYLDQSSFIAEIERIVGGSSIRDIKSTTKIEKLQLEKRLDFAVLGTLLIVLKFAYSSLISNDENSAGFPKRTEEENYLLNNSLSDDIINVAQLCLNQFKLLRRCALSIFQCALLMREYQKVDGCDGFGDGGSQIYTGMLIQMGVSIGLNRDPSKFHSTVGDSKMGNLWRKIWYGLISADNYQYMLTGTPRSINDCFYDTELPKFEEELSNNDDLELENTIIKNMHTRFEVESAMVEVADSVTNIKNPPSMEHILQKLIKLEKLLITKFDNLKNILLQVDDGNFYKRVEKVNNTIIYFQALSLIHPVYYHIMLHYQNSGNSAACKFLVNKMFTFLMCIVGNFFEIISNSFKFFGPGFDVILTPLLEVSMHKGLILLLSSYVKAVLLKEKLAQEKSEDYQLINLIDKFAKQMLVTNIGKFYMPYLKILSGRYFYAWRLLKAHGFIMSLLKGNMIDFKEQKHLFNYLEHWTAEDFKKLIELSNPINYNVSSRTSENCESLLERMHRNICDEDTSTTPIHIDHTLDKIGEFSAQNGELGTTDIPFLQSTEAGSEGYGSVISTDTNPDEDNFWLEMFSNKITAAGTEKGSNCVMDGGPSILSLSDTSVVSTPFANSSDAYSLPRLPEWFTSKSNNKSNGDNKVSDNGIIGNVNLLQNGVKNPYSDDDEHFMLPLNSPGDVNRANTNLFVDQTIYDMFN